MKKKYLLLGGFMILMLIYSFSWFRLDNISSKKVFDRYGNLLYDIKDEYRRRIFSSIEEIPTFLIDSIVLREDQRFWQHRGIDLMARARISKKILVDGELVAGGSTITQQVIKLYRGAFDRHRYDKIIEIVGSVNLEIHYTKQEIFLYYLNHLTFGNGIQGFATACHVFYQSDCRNLTNAQLLYLLSKSKFPAKKNLTVYTKNISYLYNMDIAPEEIDQAHRDLGRYLPQQFPLYLGTLMQNFSGDQEIHTSFDLDLYHRIQQLLDMYRVYIHSQGAMDGCVIIYGRDGLRSMNMLKSYGGSGTFINTCLIPRQVGSVLKPFLYAYAMKVLGLEIESKIEDKPLSFVLDQESTYTPQNYNMRYYGEVTIGQALGSSLNTPAIQLLDRVGIVGYWNFLQQIADITDSSINVDRGPHHYGLSLALGTLEISALDFAKLRTIFWLDQGYPEQQHFSFEAVKKILSENIYRVLTFPQYNWFDMDGKFVKSGTSRKFVDGWVCGGDVMYIVCVRMGNINNESMKDGGYQTAGVIRNKVISLLSK